MTTPFGTGAGGDRGKSEGRRQDTKKDVHDNRDGLKNPKHTDQDAKDQGTTEPESKSVGEEFLTDGERTEHNNDAPPEIEPPTEEEVEGQKPEQALSSPEPAEPDEELSDGQNAEERLSE